MLVIVSFFVQMHEIIEKLKISVIFYLAMRDMEMGKMPMVFPPMRYSLVVFCFCLAKKAK